MRAPSIRTVSLLSVGALTAGAALAVPAGAASPAAGTAATSAAIPFTAAAVTATSATRLRVSWTAPRSPVVLVWAGDRPGRLSRLVGVGGARGALSAPAGRQRWFTLVPAIGRRLSITRRDLGLAGDPNFRDAGGYRTTDGRWVRMGAVYRSAALTLSPAERRAVAALGLRRDWDLRTPAEERTTPDVVPAGARRIPLNVIGTPSVSLPTPTTVAGARALVLTTERQFVTAPSARRAYHRLLVGLADAPGAQVYHCSAGKDRTGWASAVLLTLLGVPHRSVVADYLLSNRYYLQSPAVQAQLAALPAAQAAVMRHLLDVEPSYLEAGFDQVRRSYGSMYGYAVHGLGLAPATIAALRDRLLVH